MLSSRWCSAVQLIALQRLGAFSAIISQGNQSQDTCYGAHSALAHSVSGNRCRQQRGRNQRREHVPRQAGLNRACGGQGDREPHQPQSDFGRRPPQRGRQPLAHAPDQERDQRQNQRPQMAQFAGEREQRELRTQLVVFEMTGDPAQRLIADETGKKGRIVEQGLVEIPGPGRQRGSRDYPYPGAESRPRKSPG